MSMERSMSEKFANNLMTIAIARGAMIITPFLLVIGGWMIIELWSGHERRITAVEDLEAKQAAQLQDHESRLVFGVAKSEIYQKAVDDKFIDIGATLKDLNSQIVSMNGSIIRLQTTIENRLPPRTAKIQPDADEKAELPQ